MLDMPAAPALVGPPFHELGAVESGADQLGKVHETRASPDGAPDPHPLQFPAFEERVVRWPDRRWGANVAR